MLFGLSIPDVLVIGAYFAIVIGIGVWSMRRIQNQEDFFLAGRRFGKVIQTFATFGQGTNVESPVGVATTTFTNGAAGIWSSLTYLCVTPFYWLIAPWMRRLRLLTMADYFEERYGSVRIAGLYTLVAVLVMMAFLSLGLTATSKTVMALSPKSQAEWSEAERAEFTLSEELRQLRGMDDADLAPAERGRITELERLAPRRMFFHMDEALLIWIIVIVVMIYTIAGGLEAAFLTDTLQGVFIILLSIILIPFTWARINQVYGGSGPLDAMHTVHARLPESFFEIFGSPAVVDFTWYYIAALSFMVLINTPAQANFLTFNAAARNEFAARFGAVVGSYMKRFCAVLWGLFALCATVLYYDKIQDSDLLWGYATYDLLGPLHMGLVGLMIACLLAALMSTADCLMITSSGLLTRNIYRPLLPGRSESHYVLVGRIFSGLVLAGGALIASRFDTILQLLKFMWEINVMVAAAFWLGLKWRRANRAGAWASMVSSALLFFLLPALLPVCFPALRGNAFLLKTSQASPITRTYRAHAMDVEMRQRDIVAWEAAPSTKQLEVARPEPLAVGETFEKTVRLPARSVFWTRGIRIDAEGNPQGQGFLSLELVVLKKLGYDLTGNAYSLNETIRVLIRTIVPFLILIVISLLTRPDDRRRLDRFFVKMKTEVRENREEDASEMERSYAQADRFDHRKLFPNSSWEFMRWDRIDTTGFVLASLGVLAVLGFLKLLISIGG